MSSPLLCNPADKERLEAENGLTMLEYVAYLVNLGVRHVTDSHVLHLQRLAVEGIYECAGNFRDARFDRRAEDALGTANLGVRIPDSKHIPPQAALIRGLVRDMLEVCNDSEIPAWHRAGYALWRINWIHPFAGGNGRVARAITYLIYCFDFDAVIPGTPTMPGLMEKWRDRYIDVLRAVDRNVVPLGDDPVAADPTMRFLRPVSRYVDAMLNLQLASAGVRVMRQLRLDLPEG